LIEPVDAPPRAMTLDLAPTPDDDQD
jgi:hypothetical protein